MKRIAFSALAIWLLLAGAAGRSCAQSPDQTVVVVLSYLPANCTAPRWPLIYVKGGADVGFYYCNPATQQYVASGGGGASLPSGTAGQSLYYPATGTTVTPLTFGPNFSLNAGTLMGNFLPLGGGTLSGPLTMGWLNGGSLCIQGFYPMCWGQPGNSSNNYWAMMYGTGAYEQPFTIGLSGVYIGSGDYLYFSNSGFDLPPSGANGSLYGSSGTIDCNLSGSDTHDCNFRAGTVTASAALTGATLMATVDALSGATPAINAAHRDFTITLSANATATVSGIAAGTDVNAQICQPATGGPYTWTWPAAIHGGVTVGTTAGDCSVQTFHSFNGTTLVATSTGAINVAP